MNNPISNRQPTNVQIELAKERNRAAAERTLMAWIRTCLSLIGFGFGIDSIVSAIGNLPEADQVINPVRLSRILGLAFIALGTYAMLTAAIEHSKELYHIQQDKEYVYTARRSLGLTVAIALVCIGVFTFAGILVKAVTRSIGVPGV